MTKRKRLVTRNAYFHWQSKRNRKNNNSAKFHSITLWFCSMEQYVLDTNAGKHLS
jgi:hypothetical protein